MSAISLKEYEVYQEYQKQFIKKLYRLAKAQI
jgi:hypothetical protein